MADATDLKQVLDCTEKAVFNTVIHDSLGCNLSYAGQGFKKPGLGPVNVLALKLAVFRRDQPMPPIERAARTIRDIKVTPR